ncbi:unnamed protein product (macronuclear) [Paramecium tetraurelia]|uniref:Transmembrane protein n=1 Tax=Paramecium tetraurelia TaxID=5888 RepID=A0DAL9_PARTE|nr:uncharacterized protein GSPATT00014993001 [Paramecium tetraurelia]CAK80086.1 unnamed protein product [Paramecium tetraurelia]|eukprot:XP_001447483.1 hypothetical protein (macronuclear) [Paramecium tetraurelia strain d4-2]
MERRRLFIRGVKKFDLFAQPIQLLVNEKEYHQTIFGSLLTLGLLLLFSNLLYSKLISLFDHSNPTSLSSEIYHSQPEIYQLFPQNFTMTFAFQNSTYHTYIDDSIYVVKAQLVHKYEKIINGSKKEVWEKSELPLIECSSDMIKQKDLSEYFSHLDLPSNYCIDWNKIDKINLEGTFDAPVYQYVLIQFYICTEETKKGKQCQEQQEIKKALEQNYFSFQISSYTTNLMKPNSPYNPKGQDLFTTISSNIYKEISIYLEPLTTVTDVGLIETDLEYYKTLRYGRHTEMLDLSSNDLIMNVVIRLDTTEYVDYRTYSKIQEILAELGGLWQVLFSFFYIISKPINKISRYLELINSLFELSDSEDGDDNQCYKQYSLFRQGQDASPLSIQIPKINENQQKDGFTNKLNQEDPQERKRTLIKPQKTILTTYAEYLQKVIIRKKKKLQFGYFEAFQKLKCIVTQDNDRIKQFHIAQKQIMGQLNIVDILKKLRDVEKLKYIIFNENQRLLFDNFPNIQNQQIEDKHDGFEQQNKPSAQDAIMQIIGDQNNEMNQKLIASLDQTVSNLLKNCQHDHSEK